MTERSRIGQVAMKDGVAQIIVGNFATLALLGLASALVYLFLPYIPTLLWAQLVAFSLRGLRDRLKRGQASSDSAAATRLMALFFAGVTIFGTLFAAGLAYDAIYVARATTSAASGAEMPPWVAEQIEAAKPKVIDALEPYVDGFEADDDVFALKGTEIVEKAGLAASPYEVLALQAVDLVNDRLAGNGKCAETLDSAKDSFKEVVGGIDDDTKEKAKEAALAALGGLAKSSAAIASAVAAVGNALAASVSNVVAALVFVFSVYGQLQQPTDYITLFQRRVAPKAGDQMEILAAVAENLVITPALLAAAFAAVTFLLLLVVRAPCAATAAALAGFGGLLPVVPVEGVVTLPWTLVLVLSKRYVAAAVFAVAHYASLTKIGEVFEDASQMHRLQLPGSIISLSVVLGLERLGPQGLILGPLLLAVSSLLFDAATEKKAKTVTVSGDAIKPAVEVVAPAPAAAAPATEAPRPAAPAKKRSFFSSRAKTTKQDSWVVGA